MQFEVIKIHRVDVITKLKEIELTKSSQLIEV